MRKQLRMLAVVAALALHAATAAAGEPSAADIETATQLYKDGKALRELNDFEGALGKFRAAYTLVATPLTALELGRTYAALGKFVEARDVLLGVFRLPVRPNESAKATEARQNAAELATNLRGRIASLTIHAKGPLDPFLRLWIDGALIPSEATGASRLLNPGRHTIVLESRGQTVRSELTLGESESREVEILVPEGQAVPPPPGGTPPIVEPKPPPREGSQALRNTLVFGGFGTALVGIGVGTVTGLMTLSRASTLKDVCTTDGRCPAASQADLDASRTTGTISTVMFGVAVAGLGAGIAGAFMVGPEAPSAARSGTVRLFPGPTGIAGTF